MVLYTETRGLEKLGFPPILVQSPHDLLRGATVNALPQKLRPRLVRAHSFRKAPSTGERQSVRKIIDERQTRCVHLDGKPPVRRLVEKNHATWSEILP